MEKIILHSDLNGFFASVECFLDPSLRDLPVVVGGDPELRHGIVLAKNEAAKKYGIKTGEVLWKAKQKCPNLVSVKPHVDTYLKFSQTALEIYSRYTDEIESFGIDECWLDVTNSQRLFGTGKCIADEIRKIIFSELGITSSVGVSFNKIFAKLGSDMKKPDATSVITRDNYKDTVWRFPASDLLYVGAATASRLRKIGIFTIGDLANADAKILYSWLGKMGIVLKRFANGEDNSIVKQSGEEAPIKSIGNSITLYRDITSAGEARSVFYMLAESVAARLREHELKCKTIQIHVRDNQLVSCERQAQLPYPSCLSGEIAEKALEIFVQKYVIYHPVRTLGVRGTDLITMNTPFQLDLFSDFEKREKMEKLEHTIDDVRRRFGYESIQKGVIFVDKKLTGINAKDEHVVHPINYFEGSII